MYIERSCNFHKIPNSQSRVIKKFYDLLGRPSYFYFKPIFKKEIYLQVNKNRDVRKCFIQFSISTHLLAIESGRYKDIKADES